MFSRYLLFETAAFLIFAIPLSVMDARRFRISLVYTALGIAVFLFLRFFPVFEIVCGHKQTDFFNYARAVKIAKLCGISLFTSILVFFAGRVFSGNGLGKGDIIFGAFCSLYCLWWKNLAGIFFAAILGVLYYLFLSILDKIKGNQKVLRPVFAIPFVPFISAGAVLARIFFG